MNNFLKNRKSVRNFKSKKVEKDTIKKINSYLHELKEKEEELGFQFELFEDGGKIYESLEGIGGYAGTMIESPHYIGLKLVDKSKRAEIYGAYYMEETITKLTNLNLASCWVSLAGVDLTIKNILFDLEEESMDYLLAIGYPPRRNPFIAEAESSRLGLEDIVFENEIGSSMDIKELEYRGLADLFYYIRFAPSSYNDQPWRFLLKGNKVILLMEYLPGDEVNLTDAGIIMYYFEQLARALGIKSSWELIDKSDIKGEDLIYKYIGEFNL